MNTPILILSAALMAAMAAHAADPAETAGGARELPVMVAGASETATALVEGVDLSNRIVTLRMEDGTVMGLAVGEEARNLPQLEVGDRVVVTYQIGLAMALAPAGSGIRERTDTAAFERAPLGQKPGGAVRRTVDVTAVVRAVDPAARTVTLQGAQQTVTLKVSDAVDLANVKVGDEVDALYQESLAIRVEPAPSAGGQ